MISKNDLVMPPTSKKLEGQIASGLHNFRTVNATVLKFLIWIPLEKKADTYFFFLTGLCPFSDLWPFEKYGCNLVSKISKKLLKLEP